MIKVYPVGENGFSVTCPHCGGHLFTTHETDDHRGDFLYFDGDIVPVYHRLEDARRTGFGCSTRLNVGECALCDAPIIGIEACMIAVEPDEKFEDRYFFRNEYRGYPTNFVATRGEETWIMSRFDTPLGPMFEHIFNPQLDKARSPVDANSVAAGPKRPGWEPASDFLLERWDELVEHMRAATASTAAA